MKGIADTGFIVAAASREDTYHRWAVKLAHGLTEPLLTCEAVLAESAFHLGSSSYVLSLLEDGMLQVAFDFSENVHNYGSWRDDMRIVSPILPIFV